MSRKVFSIQNAIFSSLVHFCLLCIVVSSTLSNLKQPLESAGAFPLEKTGIRTGEQSSWRKNTAGEIKRDPFFNKLPLWCLSAVVFTCHIFRVEKGSYLCHTKGCFSITRWIKIIIISDKFKPHACLAAFPSCWEFIQRPFYLWWNTSDITLCHGRML